MKTTPQHFDLFKKEVRAWVDTFGLKQYELQFTNEYDACNVATVDADTTAGMASFNLSNEWDNHPLTKAEVARAAFHEVYELLLFEIRQLLGVFYSQDVVNKKIHDVVRRAENHQFS